MAAPAAPSSGDELPIDVDLIKVLASDTRRDILRLLGERRRTLTELSAALDLKKATVLEHLKKLVESGLIKRLDEDDRLWIYYELSPRGKRLVNPGRTRFYLIMAGSVAALVLVGAVVAASMMLNAPGDDPAPMDTQMVGDTYAAGGPPLDTTVWRGFDANLSVPLDVTSANGTLLVGDPAAPHLAVASAGDAVTLAAEEIDALPAGRLPLTLRTEAGDLPLPRKLDVRDAPIAVDPLIVRADTSVRVRLALGEPGLAPPPLHAVELSGESIPVEDGGHLTLPRLSGDRATLAIGRLATVELRVVPAFALEIARQGDDLHANLTDADAPLANATLRLDGAILGVTNETGSIVAPWPSLGEHALRIEAADGRSEERGVLATGSALEPLAPRLSLSAYHAGGPAALSAHVSLENAGPANETVTLVARLRGEPIASVLVDVPARGLAVGSLRADVHVDAPVEISALAIRAVSTNLGDDRAAAGAPNDEGPMSAAAPAPAVPFAKLESYYSFDSAADARTTLDPVSTQPAASESGERVPPPADTPEAATPGPSPILLVTLVGLGAWAASRLRRWR